jgi:hypothetical protein
VADTFAQVMTGLYSRLQAAAGAGLLSEALHQHATDSMQQLFYVSHGSAVILQPCLHVAAAAAPEAAVFVLVHGPLLHMPV